MKSTKLSHLMACAGAFVAAGFLATVLTAASPVPPADSTNGTSTQIPAGAVEIPMYAVPHTSSKAGGIQPYNTVIPGNCGTAFLYTSNAHDHVHYDFGFTGLGGGMFWATAHINASNIDYGEGDVNSFNGAAFGSTWEKQGNLYAGTGEYDLVAYIHSFGALYDCTSSPAFVDSIYVY